MTDDAGYNHVCIIQNVKPSSKNRAVTILTLNKLDGGAFVGQRRIFAQSIKREKFERCMKQKPVSEWEISLLMFALLSSSHGLTADSEGDLSRVLLKITFVM
jgi:hypothetical protein